MRVNVERGGCDVPVDELWRGSSPRPSAQCANIAIQHRLLFFATSVENQENDQAYHSPFLHVLLVICHPLHSASQLETPEVPASTQLPHHFHATSRVQTLEDEEAEYDE
jgi:hypothetical protein